MRVFEAIKKLEKISLRPLEENEKQTKDIKTLEDKDGREKEIKKSENIGR